MNTLYVLASASPPAWLVGMWQALIVVLIGFLCWLAAGVMNWLLWWESHTDWEKWAGSNPKKAILVRLLRAWGPHLRKFLEVWRDQAAKQARQRGVTAPVIDLTTPKLPPPPKTPSDPSAS